MDDATVDAQIRLAAQALASATFGDYEPGSDADLYDWHAVRGSPYDEVRRVVPLRRAGTSETTRSALRVTFVARFQDGTATLLEHGVARVVGHGVETAPGETFGSERVLRVHARPLVDADARTFTVLGEGHGFLYAQHRQTGDIYRRPLDADSGFQLYTLRSAWLLRGRNLIRLSEPTFPPTATVRPESPSLRDRFPPAPRPEDGLRPEVARPRVAP